MDGINTTHEILSRIDGKYKNEKFVVLAALICCFRKFKNNNLIDGNFNDYEVCGKKISEYIGFNINIDCIDERNALNAANAANASDALSAKLYAEYAVLNAYCAVLNASRIASDAAAATATCNYLLAAYLCLNV